MSFSHPQTRIILVSPLYAGNVGAIARLAANFAIPEIILVNPRCDPLAFDAKLFAVGVAREDLERMQVVDSLKEALHGFTTRVAFSCRDYLPHKMEIDFPVLETLSVNTPSLALVFGKEDTGLSREDILLCTHICTIPTSERKSSMNLSHAAAVVLSRLYFVWQNQVQEPTESTHESKPASGLALDLLMNKWTDLLSSLELCERDGPLAMGMKIRDILSRAKVTEHELKTLHAFVNRALSKTKPNK